MSTMHNLHGRVEAAAKALLGHEAGTTGKREWLVAGDPLQSRYRKLAAAALKAADAVAPAADQPSDRRHAADRPMKRLTDDEIEAMREVGRLADFLRPDLKTHLETVADLAFRESEDRWLAEQLNTDQKEAANGDH